MDAQVKQLLRDFALGNINPEQFRGGLPAGIQLTKEYVSAEINAAIDQPEREELNHAIRLLWVFTEHEEVLDVLHRLLLTPHHYHHQYITKSLQNIGSPSSLPFIRTVLESDFGYLKYTASEPEVIAKWFSWALRSIGTPEAIQTIRDFAQSTNKGIRREMRYRLRKMGLKP